jgi:PAS domain S-box-containing protein
MEDDSEKGRLRAMVRVDLDEPHPAPNPGRGSENARSEPEAAESKYYDLYDLAPVGFIYLSNDLIIKGYNPAASKLFGVRGDDLVGTDFSRYVPSDRRESLYLHYRRLAHGMDGRSDTFPVQRGGGERIQVHLESIRVGGGPGIVYLTVLTDVTDLKDSEETLKRANHELENGLRESEGKYRRLFDGIQSPISIYKFVYNDRGEIVHWTLEDTNPAGLELLGRKSLEAVRGKNETELYGPNNLADRLPLLKRLRSNGGQIVSEMHFDWSERYYISSLVLMDPDHFISSVTDITEIKKAQTETEESEARYRSLFENNQAPMLVIDPKTGEILDANQIASEYYGHSHDVLTRMNIDQINTLDPDAVKQEMDQSLNGTKKKFDFRHRLSNGDVRDVEVYSGVIHVKGHPLLYSIIHDVTERKEIEREVVKRTNDLARSNAELQQFAYISSHDLQEPLRMVVSYLTLLDKKYRNQLDPKAQEYIKNAVEGGSRMRQLIDDLLEYSRLDTSRKEFVPVDMNKILESTINLLKVPIEESRAEILIGPLPTIMADGSQMIQLMQNLVGNAIKFHGPERPKVEITEIHGAKFWTFSVKDNGIGLNTAYRDKIFQMFQRLHTKDQYPGTGVGLAIAKKIVEHHGGRIWVESEEGNGATFLFTVPKPR